MAARSRETFVLIKSQPHTESAKEMNVCACNRGKFMKYVCYAYASMAVICFPMVEFQYVHNVLLPPSR
ncbi:hypothetical protein NDU88_002344 [Pleurodeles waltl]|uniref:Uncharacterized protein n=1 Tax=Pleurodeles waltl TaxID=8319 RepID=A0AAV7RD25_PLEWA|nr:hypothetical protein NDU88_002344 [Pleurodeles waltl]